MGMTYLYFQDFLNPRNTLLKVALTLKLASKK